MKVKIRGRSLELRPGVVLGAAFAALGVVLVTLAFSAQVEIDRIGPTNDPALQERLSVLEDQRDTYLLIGVSTILVGVFAAVVMIERNLPQVLSESQMISTARASNDIADGLSLEGNAAYLPARHGLSREKLFVPAPRNSMRPPAVVSDDLTFSPGKDGSTPGLLSEPFGRALLDRLEDDLGTKVDGAGIEAMEGALQILKHGMGVMRDFHFKERDNRTVLRVEYSGLLDACRRVRKEKPDTCRQISCVCCSCLLTAAARATGKIVRVESVDNSEDNVVFTLSLEEW